MTNLQCNAENCANNKNNFCCRPDIQVGGPQACTNRQTYCANFIDAAENAPQNAIDHATPNTSLDIHCDAVNCTYNQDRACVAEHIDIMTAGTSSGQIKTECASFESKKQK